MDAWLKGGGQSSSGADEPETSAVDAPESGEDDEGDTSGEDERPHPSTRRGRPIKRPQRYRD